MVCCKANVPKWNLVILLASKLMEIFFQLTSINTCDLSGHLPSQNWRVQSSLVQQGPFMCSALLQPWHWVSPRCLSGPYLCSVGFHVFLHQKGSPPPENSRMSAAKGTISKGKDRLPSSIFFQQIFVSFQGSIHSLVPKEYFWIEAWFCLHPLFLVT